MAQVEEEGRVALESPQAPATEEREGGRLPQPCQPPPRSLRNYGKSLHQGNTVGGAAGCTSNKKHLLISPRARQGFVFGQSSSFETHWKSIERGHPCTARTLRAPF